MRKDGVQEKEKKHSLGNHLDVITKWPLKTFIFNISLYETNKGNIEVYISNNFHMFIKCLAERNLVGTLHHYINTQK